MSDHTRRLQLADELVRRFAAAVRATQLYSPAHPLVSRNIAAFSETLALVFGQQRTITIGLLGTEFVVEDVPLPRTSQTMGDLLRRLGRAGVERIMVDRDVTSDEVSALVRLLATFDASDSGEGELPEWPHIQLGRIQVQQRVETATVDTAEVRRLYKDATSIAEAMWNCTVTEGRPDPAQTTRLVDSLAQAVVQNRRALLALTTIKNYDTYTFTHMVNVAILTMAQARALGIDGSLLREIGLAALMHDIGKVRTPLEILNKPDRLTADEFRIMQRHVVDGAEILRRTPGIPALAPVVAFEHHLRINGAGYPAGVTRPTLNLATQLCGIADVYDAMRSQRKYQQAFPSERVLAVLQGGHGANFDQHLVRRFVQVLGIYPVGHLVRLDTGEGGVVLGVNAADPYRPQVRVVLSKTGRKLNRPYDVNLWQSAAGGRWPSSVVAPLDPADFDLDPLAVM